MELSPIINNNKVKTTAAAAGIGAAALGAKEFIGQKHILNHADEYVTKVTAEAVNAKRFQTPFFAGTKEASELACKKIDEAAQKAIDFAKGGKMNLKAVGKMGAIGAGIGAAVVGGALLLRKLAVKSGVEGKKIERDIALDPEASKAVQDIKDATGAVTVQNV